MLRINNMIGVFLLAGLIGLSCSGKKAQEEKAQQKETKKVEKLPGDRFPKPRGMSAFTYPVKDTLRAKKELYKVIRDDYWDDKGGVLATNYFEVWYPPGEITVTHGMYLLEQAIFAKRRFHRVFGVIPEGPVVLVDTPDLTTYKQKTGREWWYYSVIKGDTLTFQPVYVLFKRHLGPIAISHEYYQWAIRKLSHSNAPRWLEEGMASYMSNEKNVLIDQLREFKNVKLEMDPATVERTLIDEKQRETSRIAYYHAFKMTETLISSFGEKDVVNFITALGKDGNIEKVCNEVFHKGYDELIETASKYKFDG